MGRYLTTLRYRLADDGTPGLSTLPDITLASMISRAESAIDADFVFPSQFGGFDPHVVYNYQQALKDMGVANWRRRADIPLFPAPARNIKKFHIHITNSGGTSSDAIIQPNDVVINNVNGYFEAVPLQAITYSTATVVWGLGLEPPIAEIDYESGYYIPYYGDLLFDMGDHKTFQSLRGFWASTYTLTTSAQPSTLPPVPPVAYANGVVQSSSLYTVNYTEGQIIFNTPYTAGSVPTVTGDYTAQIPDLIRDATIDQTTWLLEQRDLRRKGMGGVEQAKSGDQFLRRAKTDDQEEDQLCAKARLKLHDFKGIPLG